MANEVPKKWNSHRYPHPLGTQKENPWWLSPSTTNPKKESEMPLQKLTAAVVARLIKTRSEGRHGDGGGLYLQIVGTSASWIFRYIRHGRERNLGLGPAHAVSLVDAREAAQKHRAALVKDEDPQVERDREKLTTTLTFQEVAEEFLTKYRVGLKNQKHRSQLGTRLEMYAYPVLGRMPVHSIELVHIKTMLKSIWNEKPETANRVRGLVQKILDFAEVMGWRKGSNPARWTGNLEHVFPPVSQLREVRHHPALDYRTLPEFMRELAQQNGVAARALEFLILTNARTADVIGVLNRPDKPPLRWSDVDFIEQIWTIPKGKASAIGHRKPLMPRAMEILSELRRYRLDSVIVFASTNRPNQPLSASALRGVVRKALGRNDLSVHGFRSTFKDWAGETTSTPYEVVEASMAHGIVKSKVEAAYRRADFFDKRRKLMEAWSEFAGGGSELAGRKVIAIRSR